MLSSPTQRRCSLPRQHPHPPNPTNDRTGDALPPLSPSASSRRLMCADADCALVTNFLAPEKYDLWNKREAIHDAAQCGQTTYLNHIQAKYNADFDAPDNDGRSPLHWVETVRTICTDASHPL